MRSRASAEMNECGGESGSELVRESVRELVCECVRELVRECDASKCATESISMRWCSISTSVYLNE